MYEPPKAKTWRGQDWEWATVKLDGFRLTYTKDPLVAYGRDRREHLEYLQRFEAVRAAKWTRLIAALPPNSAVDGEIYVPGSPASDVPKGLRGEMPLAFEVFNLVLGGDEVAIEYLAHTCDELGLHAVDVYHRDQIDDVEAFARNVDAEGLVLRGEEWYKVKPEHTIDCVITGVKEGEGKYCGLIGAIEVSLWEGSVLKPIAWCSGMDDVTRLEITELADEGQLLGRVCEVKYQYTGARGGLRHPRFKRWREDKPSDECYMSQVRSDVPTVRRR